MKQAAVTAAVGFGEGSIVLMAAASPELRKAAYVERKAAEAERKELEEVGEALEYAVLFAPHGYPLKSYMPLLGEYFPEIACIIPRAEVRTLFVIPSRDAMSQQALDCSKTVQGAISEVISFGGPAYRTFPASPCVLHQLARGFAQKVLPAVAPNQLPREVAGARAGVALLVGGMIRLGFTGRAYECAPIGKDSYLPEGDIERRENQVELDQEISSRTLYQLHLAPCCTSWSLMQNLSKTTRTLETPGGDGSLEHKLRGNASMAVPLGCSGDACFTVYMSPVSIPSRVEYGPCPS